MVGGQAVSTHAIVKLVAKERCVLRPPGVVSVQLQLWGARRAPATPPIGNAGASGGGGGGYTLSTVSVTPGQSYTIVVGSGGGPTYGGTGAGDASSAFGQYAWSGSGAGNSGLGGSGGTTTGGRGATGAAPAYYTYQTDWYDDSCPCYRTFTSWYYVAYGGMGGNGAKGGAGGGGGYD